MNQAPFATGALVSPKEELNTAWTLASVGAPTTYPSAAFISKVLELFVTNQGQIGSCVGNTFEEIVRLIQLILGNPQEQLSWRFVYAVCKAIEGKKVTFADGTVIDATIYPRTAGANDGTYPALASIVIRKIGVPSAKSCPNDITLSADAFCYGRDISNIPAEAFVDAATRKSGADLTTAITKDGIKQAITYAKQNGGGVAILRRIGKEYWSDASGTTYDKARLLPMKPPAEIVSGHEELLYGYLDITKSDRADLENKRITIEALLAKYPEGDNSNADVRTQTIIFWQNHWDKDWCSTNGNGFDGGRAWEFLDVWLPFINELRVVLPYLPPAPVTFQYNFTKTLKRGDKGADVVALQHVLDLEGCYDYNPTYGSPKYTGNYLGLTQAGVKKLQEKYTTQILTPVGLKYGTGNFGTSTLAWTRKKYGITN